MSDIIREYGRIERNASEELRIARKTFVGRNHLDLRIYARNRKGEWVPTRKGCTVMEEDIPQFLAIIAKVSAEFQEDEVQ